MDAAAGLREGWEPLSAFDLDRLKHAVAAAMPSSGLFPPQVNKPAVPLLSHAPTGPIQTPPATGSVTIISEPRTFTTLPTEIRLKIYRLVIPKKIVLTIVQTAEKTARSKMRSTTYPWREYAVTSNLAILLASKQIYAEVQPLVHAASIVLAGVGPEAFISPSMLPDKVLSRVDEMIVFDTRFACLSPQDRATGLSWCRNVHSPRLHTIHVESPLQYLIFLADFDIVEKYNVRFPIEKMLPHVAQWIQEERVYHQSSFDLPPVSIPIQAAFMPVPLPNNLDPLAKTIRVIRQNHVVLKSRYRFEIVGKKISTRKDMYTDRVAVVCKHSNLSCFREMLMLHIQLCGMKADSDLKTFRTSEDRGGGTNGWTVAVPRKRQTWRYA